MTTNMKCKVGKEKIAIGSAILDKSQNVRAFRTERRMNTRTDASCKKKAEVVDNVALQIERQRVEPDAKWLAITQSVCRRNKHTKAKAMFHNTTIVPEKEIVHIVSTKNWKGVREGTDMLGIETRVTNRGTSSAKGNKKIVFDHEESIDSNWMTVNLAAEVRARSMPREKQASPWIKDFFDAGKIKMCMRPCCAKHDGVAWLVGKKLIGVPNIAEFIAIERVPRWRG
jgi:hypothetical protein